MLQGEIGLRSDRGCIALLRLFEHGLLLSTSDKVSRGLLVKVVKFKDQRSTLSHIPGSPTAAPPAHLGTRCRGRSRRRRRRLDLGQFGFRLVLVGRRPYDADDAVGEEIGENGRGRSLPETVRHPAEGIGERFYCKDQKQKLMGTGRTVG